MLKRLEQEMASLSAYKRTQPGREIARAVLLLALRKVVPGRPSTTSQASSCSHPLSLLARLFLFGPFSLCCRDSFSGFLSLLACLHSLLHQTQKPPQTCRRQDLWKSRTRLRVARLAEI